MSAEIIIRSRAVTVFLNLMSSAIRQLLSKDASISSIHATAMICYGYGVKVDIDGLEI